ncbi:ornithine aminotransferase (plasmid) [Thermovirga lienii DSM 17291]|jgi:ornithine--oxo-acid transaminase|uniref:ornithine aminotransferase n=1 Tax=Thermovirga lienii (strain ATCC BAA-1197 / DSM 17291 / Cas60314) TaxID=580340 RepID=G7VAG7_THELD|nr:ornithine--oxo-acid transaminase [Thermovirga lienii]AER67617.1 ornithine aminotransferase [Thermovirga lienii DSM 17291]MDN5319314.1 ornithine--oxo-acid transaminase [Thermovirga sp.]MDN5368622.1 ornithine--oxo-acid transaminase [Thermovirga sp.]
MAKYTSQELMEMEHKYGAHNYHPLEVVISKAEGIWVEDPEGRRYMDMLSAYSAVNQGHRHPRIIQALKEQADILTLTSRAFFNDRWPLFAKKLAELTGKDMVLPMNTGAEAVETAIKTMRKWGYRVKGVEKDKAEIIVFEQNFHGRTTTIISFSVDPVAKDDYGPYTPGFVIVPYDDLEAVEKAINKNTVGILVEPIQGEAGVVVPSDGFLKGLEKLAKENNVLLAVDEIQTGFCRTGKLFAFQHEDVDPDIIIMGKALGGGVMPVSAVAANKDVLGVFEPGSHGSTFGGNPLACAVAMTAIDVLLEENMAERAKEMGEYFMAGLKAINSPKIKQVRGKGLLIGVVLNESAGKARKYTTALKDRGILCKETHDWIIRFAPPLVITKEEIDQALEIIREVFA